MNNTQRALFSHRTPVICWFITPKWVDRQSGMITG